MLKYLFQFQEYLETNGIVSKKELIDCSMKTRHNLLVNLSNVLKANSKTNTPLEISAKIYDYYIINDDKKIMRLLKRMLPIYSRQFRRKKMKCFLYWKAKSGKPKVIYQKMKQKQENQKNKPQEIQQYSHYQKKQQENRQYNHQENHHCDGSSNGKLKAKSPKSVLKNLYEDYQWRTNLLNKSIQSGRIDIRQTTLSPKSIYDNHYHVPLKMRTSKSYGTLNTIREEYFPLKRRKYSANNSMVDIFKYPSQYDYHSKSSYRDIDKRTSASTYRFHNDSYPIKRPLKTINTSTSSKRRLDDPLNMYYTSERLSKYNPSSRPESSKTRMRSLNHSINEEETKRKTITKGNKPNHFQISSKEISYVSTGIHNNPTQINHVTLQTMPDSKLLQLATHYVTTDESLQKFKLNHS